MKKVIADPLLMIVTILIIVGFQVYWLKNNYDREQRLLESKSNIVFRTTVFELQSKSLQFKLNKDTSKSHRDIKLILRGPTEESVEIKKKLPGDQLIGISNAVRKQIDSVNIGDTTPKMLVKVNSHSVLYRSDSTHNVITENIQGDDNKVLQLVYSIDSLQDTLKLVDINTAVQKAFETEKMKIPFSIAVIDSSTIGGKTLRPEMSVIDEDVNQVTVGFSHPKTYQLQLGNSFSYLFKKISSPLLFSIFLVSVTILSFLLLYRNLIRQRKLTEIKNEFIGNITHELKTPISTVSVAIEAMKNFNALESPERTKEYLDIANNELQRLSLLVDKVLKLSMFERKEMKLNKEDFDFKMLIVDVLDSMRPQFEKYQADVQFESSGDNFIIHADKLHISSVVYNLIDNAIKYSKEQPHIEINLAKEKNIFTLTVSDNGIGIPPEYQKKIFDKFFRVPTGNTHGVKGYGLGLSYISEILREHMGFIQVESKEEKGSIFIAKIPERENDVIHFDDKRSIRKKIIRLPNQKS